MQIGAFLNSKRFIEKTKTYNEKIAKYKWFYYD